MIENRLHGRLAKPVLEAASARQTLELAMIVLFQCFDIIRI